MNGVFILLGSNLGDKILNLREAKQHLLSSGFDFINQSSVYETEPWGVSEQPWFLNGIIHCDFSKSPNEALNACLQIEKKMGRERKKKWGERLIDIDILFFEDLIIQEPNLIIPHPGIPDRRFTLMPMAELWPTMRHPAKNETMEELLAKTKDQLKCSRTSFTI